MAKLEVSINSLMALIDNPPPEVPVETIKEALAGDLAAVRAAFREDLVSDQGGYWAWIWAFADASITRGSRRFSQ